MGEGVDHLEDGAAAAGAEVPGSDSGLGVAEVVQCCEMTLGEIDDVDIVADCGTVSG